MTSVPGAGAAAGGRGRFRQLGLYAAYAPGKFVYHCHIMAHEDNGMMAVIEVTGGLKIREGRRGQGECRNATDTVVKHWDECP